MHRLCVLEFNSRKDVDLHSVNPSASTRCGNASSYHRTTSRCKFSLSWYSIKLLTVLIGVREDGSSVHLPSVGQRLARKASTHAMAHRTAS